MTAIDAVRVVVEEECGPDLRASDLVLVRSDDGEEWIALRAGRAAPSPDAPHGALDLAVVCRGEDRREQAQRVPLDAVGQAAAGPFVAGGLVATFRFTVDGERRLGVKVRAHRE